MGNQLIDDYVLLTIAQEFNGWCLDDLENIGGRVASQSEKYACEISVQEVKRSLKNLSKEGFVKIEASQAGQDRQFIMLSG